MTDAYPTLSQWIVQCYWDYWKDESKAEYKLLNHVHKLNELVKGHPCDVPINEITQGRLFNIVKDIKDSGKAEGLATATINRRLSILRRAVKLARYSGKIEPALEIQLLPQKNNARDLTVSSDLYDLLLQTLDNAAYNRVVGLYLRIAYETGCRWSEMQPDNMELDSKTNTLTFVDTKNGDSRSLPVTDVVVDAVSKLKRYKARGGTLSYSTALRHLKGAYEAVTGTPAPAGFGFHTMRHTRVTELVRSGTPEGHAMAITGHKSRAMFDRYTHLSPEDLRPYACQQQ